MERNLVALNTTLNLAELAAIVGGYIYLDKRIRRLEGKAPADLGKIEFAATNTKNDGKLERDFSTTLVRISKLEEALMLVTKRLSELQNEAPRLTQSTLDHPEFKNTARMGVSPSRNTSILKGRSRIVSEVSSEPEVDLDEYSHLN